MPFTYLASPYSHPDSEVRAARYRQACKATAYLMGRGHTVYSPIVHSHVLHTEWGLDGDWEFWEKHDLAMLSRARAFVILGIDG